MTWCVYCKVCKLRFWPKDHHAEQVNERVRTIALRCPYCGHSDQYTPADLLRALEASNSAMQ